MKINTINNTNFTSRIKIQKPQKPEILEGLALTGIGATSSFIALDSSNIIPSTTVETSLNSTISVLDERSAESTAISSLASIPMGSVNCIYGTITLNSSLKQDKNNTKKIPS